MKAPSPPPTPDPYATANAQQMASVAVAKANTALQNADEDSPDGTVRYIQLPDNPIYVDQRDSDGDIVGQDIVYRWKRVKSLTPKAQIAFDQQQDIAIAMNEASLFAARASKDKWSSPFSLSMLPARAVTPTAPALVTTAPVRRPMQREIGQDASIAAERKYQRDQMMERLNWQIGTDRKNLLIDLRHKGIPTASQAWEEAMRVFDRQATDNRLQIESTVGQEHQRLIEITRIKAQFHNDIVEKEFALDMARVEFGNKTGVAVYQMALELANFVNTTRAQSMQEFFAERSQITNEVSALMKGGQVTIPQFQQFQSSKIAETPIMESVYRSAAMDMQKYQIQVQQQGQMFGGMMGLIGNAMPMMMGMSDRRLKTDIVKVSNDARGFGWYVWRYLWDRPGTQRYGVMAQEVQHIPGAVHRIGGWLAVDYRVLA